VLSTSFALIACELVETSWLLPLSAETRIAFTMPSRSPSNFDDTLPSGITADDVFAFATHRIDSPHVISEAPQSELERENRAERVASDNLRELPSPNPIFSSAPQSNCPDSFELDPQSIRQAHEDDLIGFLQHWSEDLDQRSARLHADIATQERRERAFRLWMQNQRTEWEQKMRDCELMHRQAEAVARRLAFSG
jgi:hypothetical protein